MIPELILVDSTPWKLLPSGIHLATLSEVAEVYGMNPVRRRQFAGLVRACEALASAGCRTLFLDGSYVTGKLRPGDYDACWDPTGVSIDRLDPTFLNFDNKREAQKVKYEGEFFPFMHDSGTGQTFLEFFKTDRFSGESKGIIAIDLSCEPFNFVTGDQS